MSTHVLAVEALGGGVVLVQGGGDAGDEVFALGGRVGVDIVQHRAAQDVGHLRAGDGGQRGGIGGEFEADEGAGGGGGVAVGLGGDRAGGGGVAGDEVEVEVVTFLATRAWGL